MEFIPLLSLLGYQLHKVRNFVCFVYCLLSSLVFTLYLAYNMHWKNIGLISGSHSSTVFKSLKLDCQISDSGLTITRLYKTLVFSLLK